MVEFGVLTPPTFEYEVLRDLWLECERLGFNSAFIYDHLQDPPYTLSWYRQPYYTFDLVPHKRAKKEVGTSTQRTPMTSNLECWTVLSALASETKRLRLGPFVLCNSFRQPSLTAKMASTLDVISNGRLEFGIGAGWYEKEFHAYGLHFPPIAVRMRQLREAIQIIKKLWTEEKVSYAGEFYSVEEVVNMPRPIQKPHPPIWVGGSGEKFLLRIVAELANAWSMPGKGIPLKQYKHKLQVLKQHCVSVGREPDEIRKGWQGEVIIVEKEAELKQKIRRIKQESPAREIREQPLQYYLESRIVGTPDQCITKILKYVDVGVTYFILLFPDILKMKPLELFSEHVKSVF